MFSLSRSNHLRRSIKKLFLKFFAVFTRKDLCWSLFCNFIKEKLQRRGFFVNITKSLRAPTLKNICEQLLLIDRTYVNYHIKWKTEKGWFHFFAHETVKQVNFGDSKIVFISYTWRRICWRHVFSVFIHLVYV